MAKDRLRTTGFTTIASGAKRQFRRSDRQHVVDNRAPEAIDPAYLSAIKEGRAQIRSGEFASDDEVEEIYSSVGL